jgi:hypothetical protein
VPFCRTLSFLGERICALCWREAARVARVVGAAFVLVAVLVVAFVRARLLFTTGEFSLFSLEMSSLVLFLDLIAVCLLGGGDVEILVTGLGAGFAFAAVGAGLAFLEAFRAFLATGFVVGLVRETGAECVADEEETAGALATAVEGAVAGDGARMSMMGVARRVAGIRFTRRVRRSRVLAHSVSHIASNLAMLASTVRKALAVAPPMREGMIYTLAPCSRTCWPNPERKSCSETASRRVHRRRSTCFWCRKEDEKCKKDAI